MLILPAIGDTDPIRLRRPSHWQGLFSNISGEAMRPLFGVIGIQSGPRNRGVHIGFHDSWGPGWDVGRGDNFEDSPSVFRTREGDQGDLPGRWRISEGREEGDPLGRDGVPLPARRSTST